MPLPGRWAQLILATLFAAACTSTATRLDSDLSAFANGINAILQACMPIAEARSSIRARFPKPASDTESAPLIGAGGRASWVRRYMMVWPTTDPGTAFVLTLECDNEDRLARWSTGPLYTAPR